MLFQAADVLGDRFQPCRFARERVGDAGDLSRQALVLPLLDRLSDTRQRLDAVPGIEARRVQQMFEPVAVQETGSIEQLLLGFRDFDEARAAAAKRNLPPAA